jgi:hypothetical protein
MGCCGSGRVVHRINRPSSSREPPEGRQPALPAARQNTDPPGAVLFKYTGKSGMTVFGPLTGQRYRFGQPGDVIQVDPRDAPSVVAVPHLQKLSSR